MKLHPALVKLTIINFFSCILFFFLLYRYSRSSENDRMMVVILGWIFWLGLVAYIGPQFFSDETRAEWFSRKYGVGTLVVLLINVAAAIAGNEIAYSFAK